MKLVRKNATKKLEKIFSTAKNCRSYTLHNNFSGDYVKGELYDFLKREHTLFRGKLYTDENGNCTLHIHSNCWFQFEYEN